MSMFKQVADIRTADTLKLDVPECDYQVVQVEATPFQQELVQELADRADAINAGNVDPTIDNMLKITSDGRKLGLDPRLIDPSFEDNPDTKLNRCVENVARIHAETAEDRLTQIIFCDLGVPHKAAEAAVEGEDADDAKDKKSIAEVESLEEECDFCVYDDIRDKLIARGIPAEEIAYIHDAKTEQQKADLFDNINSNYGRFNSCFLCPRSFEGISFVGQRLVDQLIKDMDRSRKVAVTWVSIDLDVLDKLQSHFTGELLRSCVGLHTADILVHITLVLPCRFGTLSQLVLFSGQLILLCLILFKQADTHLFGNFACHLILVDALDKTVKLVDTLHNIVLPFPVGTVLHSIFALLVSEELCSHIRLIHNKVNLMLNILQHKALDQLKPDRMRGAVFFSETAILSASVARLCFTVNIAVLLHLGTAVRAIAQARQRHRNTVL